MPLIVDSPLHVAYINCALDIPLLRLLAFVPMTDDEVDSFRWSGRTPSGVGIRISALERKPRKRLGVGILFFWGAYRLRSLLGLA